MTPRRVLPGLATLTLALSPAQAEPLLTPPKPVCGEIEYVLEDGTVTSQVITENCVPSGETGAGLNTPKRTRTGLNAGAIALGVVGLGLAVAGAGGGGKTASARTPPPPGTQDMRDPAAWRGTEFNRQYGLGLVGVEHRYAKGATGQGTLGAIYDSGIDMSHSDVGGIRRDLSHSYAGQASDLSDPDGHGTHVYGIAGARRNGRGIHGVAPDATFMILKRAFGTPRDVTDVMGDFADALGRADAAGADAMNNSWGIETADPAQPDGRRILLTRDFPSADVLRASFGPDAIAALGKVPGTGLSVVFGTGNGRNGNDGATDAGIMAGLPHFLPELRDNWIAATALGDSRSLDTARIASYANHCGQAMTWCLAAPGTDITSLGAAGAEGTGADGLRQASGTSMAAPHVFGAVLVLKSQFPELTTREVHHILFDTAVDLGAPGTDRVYGRGALNLNEALAPQGDLMVELGATVDARAVPLAASRMLESGVTGSALTRALADQTALVTDAYDRGYHARLGHRVAALPGTMSGGAYTRLAAAFNAGPGTPLIQVPGAIGDERDLPVLLRFHAYGPDYDITRVAHVDPVMALVDAGTGSATGAGLMSGVSTRVDPGGLGPGGLALTTALSRAGDASAFSLGVLHEGPAGHRFGVSLGRLDERGGVLGATGFGAFGALQAQTLYGRLEGDLSLSPRTTFNTSITAAATRFTGDGLLVEGSMDSLGASIGLTWTDALARGDRLSLAVARPFSVSGGALTLATGRGISAARGGERTNHVQLDRTSVPLGDAGRVPEMQFGYARDLLAGFRVPAALRVGAIAALSGGLDLTALRAGLTLGF